MPGGVFAADENIREGKTDPRQGFETCGIGEFCKSFHILAEQIGQTFYADRSEDLLFNFETTVRLTVNPEKPAAFPLYLRVPAWAQGLTLNVCGAEYTAAGPVICVEREWSAGDSLTISFEAKITCRRWEKQKNAVSVDYGPLTYSLRIAEDRQKGVPGNGRNTRYTRNPTGITPFPPKTSASKGKARLPMNRGGRIRHR